MQLFTNRSLISVWELVLVALKVTVFNDRRDPARTPKAFIAENSTKRDFRQHDDS